NPGDRRVVVRQHGGDAVVQDDADRSCRAKNDRLTERGFLIALKTHETRPGGGRAAERRRRGVCSPVEEDFEQERFAAFNRGGQSTIDSQGDEHVVRGDRHIVRTAPPPPEDSGHQQQDDEGSRDPTLHRLPLGRTLSLTTRWSAQERAASPAWLPSARPGSFSPVPVFRRQRRPKPTTSLPLS